MQQRRPAAAEAPAVAATVVELRRAVEGSGVRRLLGYRNGARPRNERAARGAWCVVPGTVATSAGMPRPGKLVGLGACTIGPALEQEVTRRSAEGRLLDALLLDAFGSAAAEAAADELNRVLCEQARRLGRQAGPRRSPGYGRWDVRCQVELLGLLPAAALGLGLTLSPAGMLIPRKSVTFAVPFRGAVRRAEEEPPGAGSCGRCGAPGCPYRRTAADRPTTEADRDVRIGGTTWNRKPDPGA